LEIPHQALAGHLLGGGDQVLGPRRLAPMIPAKRVKERIRPLRPQSPTQVVQEQDSPSPRDSMPVRARHAGLEAREWRWLSQGARSGKEVGSGPKEEERKLIALLLREGSALLSPFRLSFPFPLELRLEKRLLPLGIALERGEGGCEPEVTVASCEKRASPGRLGRDARGLLLVLIRFLRALTPH